MDHPNTLIEAVLERYRSHLGEDYDKYRNHVYRVYSLCLLFDGDAANRDKYALAAAFHDLGIWTDRTFDYLDPSIGQAGAYLRETGRADWIDEISQMIFWHHKLSPYNAGNKTTVDNFRKADWVDLTLGSLAFGLRRNAIRAIRQRWPNAGFHVFLLKKSVQNFFMHPLNPLPVFKR
ncbi:MAG: HD domain-containing protein [Lewinellaceae bacterium]|nr:HD domain-containing protein [Lewinellaceae bacterium]